jgi:hypothetical protein
MPSLHVAHQWLAAARRCAAILAVVAVPISAQPPQRIPDGNACGSCRIRIASNVALTGEPVEYSLVEPPLGVTATIQGGIFVFTDAGVLRYAPDGRYVGSPIRQGSGPGELRFGGHAVPLPGDSMLVFDSGNARVLIFDGAGRGSRSVSYPFHWGQVLVRSWPGHVVLSGAPNRNGESQPFRLVDFTGSSTQLKPPFGPADTAQGFLAVRVLNHPMTAISLSQWLSVAPAEYIITQWQGDSEAVRSWIRRPTWFAERSRLESGTPDRAPSPSIASLQHDAAGRTWVFARKPRATWKAAWADARVDGNGEVASRQIRHDALYSTAVEVLDLARNRVITTTEIPGLIVGTLGDGRIVMFSTNVSGSPQLRVLTLKLEQP